MYVTLEPCSHVGKTGSCAEAIIESDLKKVHIATEDPNERVAGKGIEKLKSANVEVTTGLLKYEAQEINKHFFTSMTRKRPFITLKQARSEEHTSELQSRGHLVCRLLLEKKKLNRIKAVKIYK